MKKLTLMLVTIIISIGLISQTPQAFKYQAVVRDNVGDIIANQEVSFRISIRDVSTAGTIIYQETHSVTTNDFGLAILEVGNGAPPITGAIADIDWGTNPKFLEVELDPANGSSYVSMGTTQLLAVPYSLYAESTGDTSRWKKNNDDLYFNNGNVGIGTDSPGSWAKLDVKGNLLVDDGNAVIKHTDATESFLNMYNTISDWELVAAADNNRFDIRKWGGAPALSISDNNFVGIGTTNPGAKLDVRGNDTDDGPVFTIGNSDGSHKLSFFPGREYDPNPFIQWKEGDPLRFSTDEGGWSEKMRITSDGNVGIGTTTPLAALHVEDRIRVGEDPSAPPVYGELYHEGGGSGFIINANAGGGGWADLYMQTNGITKMFIESNGNVGIGTTTPLSKLHIENVDISLQGSDIPNEHLTIESSDAGLGLYSSNGGGYGSVLCLGEVVSGTLNNKWSIFRTTSVYSGHENQLRFSYGTDPSYAVNPTVLTLDEGGNVGIGTTTPSEMLEVADTIYSTVGGFKFPDGTVQETAAIGSGTGNTLDQAYDQGGAGAGRIITADNGAVNILGNDGLTVNGNVGIGTTSPSYPLTILPGTSSVGALIDHDLSVASYDVHGLEIDVDKDITGDTHIYGASIQATNNFGGGGTFGIRSNIDGSSNGAKYGVYSEVEGVNSDNFALWGSVDASGSGTHYGIFGQAKDWAGYFLGNSRVTGRLSIGGGDDSAPTADLEVRGIDGVVFGGDLSYGEIPASGPGTRMMWYPYKAAFRAGMVEHTEWDELNIGQFSFAIGANTTAKGFGSFAVGKDHVVEGNQSFIMGYYPRFVTANNAFVISLDESGPSEISQDNSVVIYGGKVGINEAAPKADLHIVGQGGIISSGEYNGFDPVLISGHGTRMVWSPGKAAFRVGGAYDDYWDDVNTGDYSIAAGAITKAKGWCSSAFGEGTEALGNISTAMGNHTKASGEASTALGSLVRTSGEGSFAIGDLVLPADSSSFSTANQFNARFANGYNLYTSSDLSSGAQLLAGANSWSSISDSTKKENFRLVNGEDFLNKISQFKLTSWNYIGQDAAKFRHYGPMAQDFFAAFGHDGIGTIGCDTLLSSADFDGINFIAIQALEKRTSILQSENEQLKEELAMLRSEMERFETLLQRIEDLSAINKQENQKEFAKSE